jgi:hypothetical protein
MLFCYPIAAVEENWLHDAIVEMISAALASTDELVAWPGCIPAEYRVVLRGRVGLRDRFARLCAAAVALSPGDKNVVLSALISQNNIPAIFDGSTECVRSDELPAAIRPLIDDLSRFAFALLSDLGQRDRQYDIIYKSMPNRVCPFCGCEYFDAPSAPRHHLDHYMPMSHYPFAGANLRNLVPAGDRCNSAFKRDSDVLRRNDGERRRVFDPYGSQSASVSLLKSRPFGRKEGRLPEWDIDLGETPEAVTWDSVWRIRERYGRDILDAEYRNWLDHFAQWCRLGNRARSTRNEIAVALNEYIQSVIQEGFADRAFLKRAMFEMLASQSATGADSDRLADFLLSLVSADRGAAA